MPQSLFFDEKLTKFMRNMDILFSYVSKDKEGDIPRGILEELIEARENNVFQKEYRQEAKTATKSLNYLVALMMNTLARKRQPIRESREIKTPTETTKSTVYSFEHYKDLDIREISQRVKGEPSFWVKYVCNYLTTKNPRDFQAVRIIVECEEAREYRWDEKKQMYRTLDELGKPGRREYKELFEEKNIQLMKKTANQLFSKGVVWEPMAFNPLYLTHDNPSYKENIRSTSQTYFNSRDENVFADIYVWTEAYKKIKKQQKQILVKLEPKTLAERVSEYFERFKSKLNEDKTAYKTIDIELADEAISFECIQDDNLYNRYLIRRGNIILDFYSADSLEERDIIYFAERILSKLDDKNKDSKDKNLIPEIGNLALKYEDINPGWFIRNDIMLDVEEREGRSFLRKHPLMALNKEEKGKYLCKEYIGEDKKKNGYQSIHVLLKLGTLEAVALYEVQIKDPLMEWVAEKGSASHDKFKRDRLKEVESENPRMAKYAKAFFGSDEECQAAFEKIKYEVIERDFKKGFSEFKTIVYESIPSGKISDSFIFLEEAIDEALDKARKSKSEVISENIISTINEEARKVIPDYIESQGNSLLTNAKSLIDLAGMLYLSLKNKGIEIKELITKDVETFVYSTYFRRLTSTYESMIKSNKKEDKLLAFILGEFIQNIKSYDELRAIQMGEEILQRGIDTVSQIKKEGYAPLELTEKWRDMEGVERKIETIPQGLDRKFLQIFRNRDRIKYFRSLGFDDITAKYLDTISKGILNEILTRNDACGYKYQIKS